MSRPWFDADTGGLVLDRYVMETPSFQRILADDRVTDEELAQQAQQVTTLLCDLERKLPDDAKATFTEAMAELAVLNELYQKRLDQDE